MFIFKRPIFVVGNVLRESICWVFLLSFFVCLFVSIRIEPCFACRVWVRWLGVLLFKGGGGSRTPSDEGDRGRTSDSFQEGERTIYRVCPGL